MVIRRHRRQFHIEYRAENILLQLLPIWQSLSRHLNYISLYGVAANGVTGVTGQSYFLPYIFAQANPVKELWQDVKLSLGLSVLVDVIRNNYKTFSNNIWPPTQFKD